MMLLVSVWTFAWILIPLLRSWDTVWPQDTGIESQIKSCFQSVNIQWLRWWISWSDFYYTAMLGDLLCTLEPSWTSTSVLLHLTVNLVLWISCLKTLELWPLNGNDSFIYYKNHIEFLSSLTLLVISKCLISIYLNKVLPVPHWSATWIGILGRNRGVWWRWTAWGMWNDNIHT